MLKLQSKSKTESQEVLNAGFTKVTSRSVKYFGFLVGVHHGSSIDYRAQLLTYNIWYTKEKGRAETLPSKMLVLSKQTTENTENYLNSNKLDDFISTQLCALLIKSFFAVYYCFHFPFIQ